MGSHFLRKMSRGRNVGSACCALLSNSHHQPCTGSLWPWRYRALSPDASPLQQHSPLSRTHLDGPVLRPRSAACSTGPKLVSPKHTKAETLSWGFSTLKPSIPSGGPGCCNYHFSDPWSIPTLRQTLRMILEFIVFR